MEYLLLYKLSISLNELCCIAAVHVVVKIIVLVSNFDYETFDAFCLPHHHCCSLSIQSNVSNRFDVIATINTHGELYVEEGEHIYTQWWIHSTGGGELESMREGLNLSIRIDSR